MNSCVNRERESILFEGYKIISLLSNSQKSKLLFFHSRSLSHISQLKFIEVQCILTLDQTRRNKSKSLTIELVMQTQNTSHHNDVLLLLSFFFVSFTRTFDADNVAISNQNVDNSIHTFSIFFFSFDDLTTTTFSNQ